MQAAAEIADGAGRVGGGGLLEITDIGAPEGALVQVTGVAEITHGTLIGANTIKNIRQDTLLNENANSTVSSSSGASKTEPSLPPDPARKPRGVSEPNQSES